MLFLQPATQGAQPSSVSGMLIPLLLVFVVFYFFMIRPESKKKKALEAMRNNMKVGDQVTTIGGIVGEICSVKGDIIVLETGADRVRVEFNKWAISTNNSAEKEAAKQQAATQKSKKKQ